MGWRRTQPTVRVAVLLSGLVLGSLTQPIAGQQPLAIDSTTPRPVGGTLYVSRGPFAARGERVVFGAGDPSGAATELYLSDSGVLTRIADGSMAVPQAGADFRVFGIAALTESGLVFDASDTSGESHLYRFRGGVLDSLLRLGEPGMPK
ncbi:MAG: hypothetical protein AAGK22_21565, partial [Acidobacteriota bacterium]